MAQYKEAVFTELAAKNSSHQAKPNKTFDKNANISDLFWPVCLTARDTTKPYGTACQEEHRSLVSTACQGEEVSAALVWSSTSCLPVQPGIVFAQLPRDPPIIFNSQVRELVLTMMKGKDFIQCRVADHRFRYKVLRFQELPATKTLQQLSIRPM